MILLTTFARFKVLVWVLGFWMGGLLLGSVSLLHAEETPISLRGVLGEVNASFQEGKYIHLTPEELQSLTTGYQHLINNFLVSKSYLELSLQRYALEGETRRLYELLLGKIGALREGMWLCNEKVTPENADQLAQGLARAHGIALEILTPLSEIKDQSMRGRLHEGIISTLNIIELSLRMFKKEAPLSLKLDTLSNFWALVRLSQSKDFQLQMLQGKFLSTENSLLLSYFLRPQSDFLARFSLLALLVDFEQNPDKILGPKSLFFEVGKFVMLLPYRLQEEQREPWRTDLRYGRGWGVQFAKIFLERRYGARFSYAEGLRVEIPLPTYFPIERGRLEMEAAEESVSLRNVVQLMNEGMPLDVVMRSSEADLFCEQLTYDLVKTFPSGTVMTQPELRAVLERYRQHKVFGELLTPKAIDLWLTRISSMRSWDPFTIREALRLCILELRSLRH